VQLPANKPQRYVASAQIDRKGWSALYSSGAVTQDQAIHCLSSMRARCNLTALGQFLAIEAFH